MYHIQNKKYTVHKIYKITNKNEAVIQNNYQLFSALDITHNHYTLNRINNVENIINIIAAINISEEELKKLPDHVHKSLKRFILTGKTCILSLSKSSTL